MGFETPSNTTFVTSASAFRPEHSCARERCERPDADIAGNRRRSAEIRRRSRTCGMPQTGRGDGGFPGRLHPSAGAALGTPVELFAGAGVFRPARVNVTK